MNDDHDTPERDEGQPALPAPTRQSLSLTAGLVDLDVARALAAVDDRVSFYAQTRDRSLPTLPHPDAAVTSAR
jgi:hypothetical protein